MNVRDVNRNILCMIWAIILCCHENLNQFRLPFLSIRGFDHQLYTVLQNKVVLNNFDSKMYICDCNIHTFFYGSKNLKSVCEKCN